MLLLASKFRRFAAAAFDRDGLGPVVVVGVAVDVYELHSPLGRPSGGDLVAEFTV